MVQSTRGRPGDDLQNVRDKLGAAMIHIDELKAEIEKAYVREYQPQAVAESE